ncbi:MAG: hypothetical protein M1114_06630, partial [Candidatus Dependentiae bacterium]|nr:hypothetical protein [Candidatus Dependentiae bacterium]
PATKPSKSDASNKASSVKEEKKQENKKEEKTVEKADKKTESKPAGTKEEELAPLPVVAEQKKVTVPMQKAEEPTQKKEQPIKEKAHPAYQSAEEAEMEAVDIDTIDLAEPKGNWLLKRQWWEAAERSYEQVKKIVDQIFDTRLAFYNERSGLDRSVFNNFFYSVGMGQGELQEIVETLTQETVKDKNQKGLVSKKDQDVYDRIKEEKDRLKKLYDTIEHISEIEKALNAALITMREQIEIARENERNAWNNFKMIARELSDHKAYELYYGMNSFTTNVSEIYKYLSGPFADYYHQLGERAKKDIEEVLETMKTLKEKGVDLKQYAEELVHKQVCSRQEVKKEEEIEEKTGFFGTMWKYIKAPFVFIASSFADTYDGVRSLFVKAPVDEEEDVQE